MISLAGLCGLLLARDLRAKGNAAGLTVSAAELCHGINEDRDPEGILKIDDVVGKRPIYLWTVLSGDLQTLRVLKERGLLPIRHRWYYSPALKFDEVPSVDQLVDPKPIRAGTINHLAKLRSEALLHQVFNWRTWSQKSNLQPGIYVVQVTFQDGSAVLDQSGKPSEVRFKYEP